MKNYPCYILIFLYESLTIKQTSFLQQNNRIVENINIAKNTCIYLLEKAFLTVDTSVYVVVNLLLISLADTSYYQLGLSL